MSLHRLVYYSRNSIQGGPTVLGPAVESILATSRINNRRVNVTGALMFNSGCFAQVLEGELAPVEETFERIQQDSRHGEVNVLALEPVAARVFADWSMGFIGASVQDAAHHRGVAAQTGFDPARMTSLQLFETMRRLAYEEEAA